MPERSAALVAVIPARIGSTRFPEKPLARIAGVPMIARVVERVRESGAFDHILVATDDERIANAARNAGADARMTDSDLANGTLRCHAALCQWEAEVGYEATWVVNVQGDEPFVHPEQLQKLAQLIRKAGTSIATLARPKSADDAERANANRVKVVCDLNGHALYFSRLPLPSGRGLGWNTSGCTRLPGAPLKPLLTFIPQPWKKPSDWSSSGGWNTAGASAWDAPHTPPTPLIPRTT